MYCQGRDQVLEEVFADPPERLVLLPWSVGEYRTATHGRGL